MIDTYVKTQYQKGANGSEDYPHDKCCHFFPAFLLSLYFASLFLLALLKNWAGGWIRNISLLNQLTLMVSAPSPGLRI